MQLISNEALDALVEAARSTPRRRANRNLHPSLDDPVNRLVIAMEPDSYVRPHRHPERWELLLAVRGAFDVLLFDYQGVVSDRFLLAPGLGMAAIEVPVDTVHTLVSRESGSVFFEVKQGPYAPTGPEHFAPWSPTEGSSGASMFLDRIRYALPGSQLG